VVRFPLVDTSNHGNRPVARNRSTVVVLVFQRFATSLRDNVCGVVLDIVVSSLKKLDDRGDYRRTFRTVIDHPCTVFARWILRSVRSGDCLKWGLKYRGFVERCCSF